MTKHGRERSLQLHSGPGLGGQGHKEPPWPALGPWLCDVGLLTCSPRPGRPKSAVSHRGTQPGESPRRPPGLTSPPGLAAPLLAAFSRRLSICMKRKSNACLGLDRTAELRAISCPLLKDITLSR